MAVTDMEGASGEDAEEIPCKQWHGHQHKHKGPDPKPFPGGGNTKREILDDWARPHMVYKKGNSTLKKITYKAFWGYLYTSKLETYLSQKHHVIPVQSMKDVPDLANNLELLGYNINSEEFNGIRMPMYDEDIFWHDLPRHFNYTTAHGMYNTRIASELKREFNAEWKLFCSDDDEQALLAGVFEYTDRLRNKIIQWNADYFVVSNGGNRSQSFINAGLVPKPANKGRKYPNNTTM